MISTSFKQDIAGLFVLLTLGLFTCTNTSEPLESYGSIPSFSAPFMEFDSLMDAAEIKSDSVAKDFNQKILSIKRTRAKRDTIRSHGHPFGRGYGNRK